MGNCCGGGRGVIENNGFVKDPQRLFSYKVFGAFWEFVFIVVYFVYAGNHSAVFLNDQGLDRYFTFTFWRLAASGLDILGAWFLGILLLFPVEFWQTASCLVQLAALALDLVLLGWLGYDTIDCANVPHCDGDGMGPLLGLDAAFIILAATLILRAVWFFVSLVFCIKLRNFYLDVRDCNRINGPRFVVNNGYTTLVNRDDAVAYSHIIEKRI